MGVSVHVEWKRVGERSCLISRCVSDGCRGESRGEKRVVKQFKVWVLSCNRM